MIVAYDCVFKCSFTYRLFSEAVTVIEYKLIDTFVVGNEESGGILTAGKLCFTDFR
jgi:hypothetical protein